MSEGGSLSSVPEQPTEEEIEHSNGGGETKVEEGQHEVNPDDESFHEPMANVTTTRGSGERETRISGDQVRGLAQDIILHVTDYFDQKLADIKAEIEGIRKGQVSEEPGWMLGSPQETKEPGRMLGAPRSPTLKKPFYYYGNNNYRSTLGAGSVMTRRASTGNGDVSDGQEGRGSLGSHASDRPDHDPSLYSIENLKHPLKSFTPFDKRDVSGWIDKTLCGLQELGAIDDNGEAITLEQRKAVRFVFHTLMRSSNAVSAGLLKSLPAYHAENFSVRYLRAKIMSHYVIGGETPQQLRLLIENFKFTSTNEPITAAGSRFRNLVEKDILLYLGAIDHLDDALEAALDREVTNFMKALPSTAMRQHVTNTCYYNMTFANVCAAATAFQVGATQWGTQNGDTTNNDPSCNTTTQGNSQQPPSGLPGQCTGRSGCTARRHSFRPVCAEFKCPRCFEKGVHIGTECTGQKHPRSRWNDNGPPRTVPRDDQRAEPRDDRCPRCGSSTHRFYDCPLSQENRQLNTVMSQMSDKLNQMDRTVQTLLASQASRVTYVPATPAPAVGASPILPRSPIRPTRSTTFNVNATNDDPNVHQPVGGETGV